MGIGITTPAAQATQLSGVGIQDFLKILTSQLNNQDPLKPLDNQEFIAQIAQFTSLEQSRQLNQKIDGMLSLQSANQSVGLLNKTIEISTASGATSGRVTALDFSGDAPKITIQTGAGAFVTDITLSQITAVR